MSENKIQLNLTPLNEWGLGNSDQLIISGPCSAETEEQVLATAHELVKLNPQVKVFRAGIWKPRTRPNNFEGVGLDALRWLTLVKKETGLKVAVEVANGQHVYECLKYGIDLLWIGARTTVNPFSVQEIADALKGVDIPVLVKNPLNPELQLWLGALERVNNAGISKLGAIHRGFSTFKKTPYRNSPEWYMAIELKRQLPELPIICDPSHITGKRSLIGEVSQKALNLAMNGLMIEAHINPQEAWSDAAQQLSPEGLHQVLSRLKFRTPEGEDILKEDLLELLREDIDDLDHELLDVIARRAEIAKKIGQYKKAHNMTILQVTRWDDLLSERLGKALALGLDETTMKEIFKQIHIQSIKIQEKVLSKANGDKVKSNQ